MQDPWMERLSEYLDGDLDKGEREPLEAHLNECAECTAVLGDLKKVRARARELNQAPVPPGLWPRIEKAIASSRGEAAPVGRVVTRVAWRAPRVSFSIPELLAAGLAVALVSGGVVFAVMRHAVPAPNITPVRVARGPESQGSNPGVTTTPETEPRPTVERETEPPTVSAVPAVRTDPEPTAAGLSPETPHEEAISELRKALARERDKLDPATIRTLEANLAIIDLAIDQAKRALAADPANTYVKEHLAETMRRKVELLQRATLLASTSNPEGTR